MNAFAHRIHRLFVPQENNNYRSRLLHLDFLTGYLIIALFLTSTFGTLSSNILGYATNVTVDKLVELTNGQRQPAGIHTLTYSPELAKAAEAKAQDMFEKNYWNHFGPNGETPWGFIQNAGYRYSEAGENLAKNFNTSDEVVSAWMASETHRQNIMDPDFEEVGFAIKNGVLEGEETTLIVQMFGTPSQKKSFIPAVQAQETEMHVSPTTSTLSPTQKTPSPTPIVSPTPHSSFIASAHFPPDAPASFGRLITSQNTAFLFVLLLSCTLLADVYVAYRYDMIRLSGKNVAHLILLGLVVASFFLIKKGAII